MIYGIGVGTTTGTGTLVGDSVVFTAVAGKVARTSDVADVALTGTSVLDCVD
jgi:hypothetical protein